MSLGQVPLIGLVPGMVCPPGAQCFPLVIASGTSTDAPTTALLTNLSNQTQGSSQSCFPYCNLTVGDQWSLVITGSPNSPVTGSASQNGANPSTSNFGTTNSQGTLELTGTFGAGDVGFWQETYQVGTGTPHSIAFEVSAPPAPAGSGSSSGSSSGGSSTSTTTPTTPPPSGLDLSFLTNNIGPLPLWAWLGGGLLAMVMVKK
jgi:hypothetical protein